MMDKIQFQIDIKASASKVWHVLWEEKNYAAWTSVFCEGGSSVFTDWNEGSPVLFLANEGNGIASIIEQKIENELMTFMHQAEIKDGIKTSGDWSGARESYHLSELTSGTRLVIKMDVLHAYLEYFNNTFPQGLLIIKKLAEEQ